jgi:hypothetical protein
VEVCVEVNAEKKYMSMSRHKATEQNHYIKVANICFENVANLKYLGTVTNQTCIHKEIKIRLNSENAYHAVQNLLPTCLLSKDVMIKIYKTI